LVRAMFNDRLKYVALAALLAIGLAGLGIHRWASASDLPGNGHPPKTEPDSQKDLRIPALAEPVNPPTVSPARAAAKPDEARPGRRREAVIRLPAGTFVKEVEVAPYGAGRLTWTYDEERVHGLIEGSVMGGEFELATEAEYSLSSNGTIYGLITSVRLNHLRLPEVEPFAQLKPFAGLWPVVEPLVNETLMDLPFSYQFRLQGDRLVISNFRMLLSGPNPFGKVGAFFAGREVGISVSAFQALGTAIEGTYTASDAKEKPNPNRKPLFLKTHGPMNAQPTWIRPTKYRQECN
jgi:hypothetical protein